VNFTKKLKVHCSKVCINFCTTKIPWVRALHIKIRLALGSCLTSHTLISAMPSPSGFNPKKTNPYLMSSTLQNFFSIRPPSFKGYIRKYERGVDCVECSSSMNTPFLAL